MIPEDLTTSSALDALHVSLQKHASAHRGPEYGDHSNGTSAESLRQALQQSKRISPLPLLGALFSRLERIPRPFLNLKLKTVAAYHFFGISGITAACLVPLILTGFLHVSLLITTTLLVASAVLTWGYIKITRLITQKNAVVFFNYFLTLLAGQWLVLRILDQPVLVYMDVLILGGGFLFAFGRIGCFMAGCCYGKPSLSGIRYDKHHKKNGFPRRMRQVRLLPLQLTESVWLFSISAFSMTLLFTQQPAGIPLTTFLILLALGRFMFEFFRGDPIRPYNRGLSHTQWTSIAILIATTTLQVIGILPFQRWQSFILASFLILLIASVLCSNNVSLHSLYSAKHIHEIAELFEIFQRGTLIPASTQKAVHLRKTSQNIQLSENRILLHDQTALHHITLSSLDQSLPYSRAVGLSRLVASVRQVPGIHVLLPDNDNIYHLIYFTIDTDA